MLLWSMKYGSVTMNKGKVKVSLGTYTKLCVASALISVTLSLEPLVGLNTPPTTQTHCNIRLTTVYVPQVSFGVLIDNQSEWEGSTVR